MTTWKKLWPGAVAATLLGIVSVGAQEPQAPQAPQAAAARTGEPAPLFELESVGGDRVSLRDLQGMVVVVEWFNPDCPAVVEHHLGLKNLQDLANKYEGRTVRFLAIASGKAAQKERLTAAARELGIGYPILMDPDCSTARAYGATTTPEVFVIDGSGALRYRGAVDEKPLTSDVQPLPDQEGARGQEPVEPVPFQLLETALRQVLHGEPVAPDATPAWGCPIEPADTTHE